MSRFNTNTIGTRVVNKEGGEAYSQTPKMEFPENNVYCLAGFSEKVFDIMKILEEDRNALINKIELITL